MGNQANTKESKSIPEPKTVSELRPSSGQKAVSEMGSAWGRLLFPQLTVFLERVKILVSAGKYDFVPRRKNMQALAQYGLTVSDAKDEILGLAIGDYYRGPKEDYDAARPGDIWEFKKNIDGIQFYVKVKIVQENGEEVLKCIGFHEDYFA